MMKTLVTSFGSGSRSKFKGTKIPSLASFLVEFAV